MRIKVCESDLRFDNASADLERTVTAGCVESAICSARKTLTPKQTYQSTVSAEYLTTLSN